MLSRSRCVCLATVLILIPTALRAAIIIEVEADGTSVNNSLATAQAIAGSAFDGPSDPNIFSLPGYPTATILGAGGANDVDFYSFFAPGGNVYFDIDNDPTTFDTILSLFDSSGTLLAYGDDSSPADLGSALSQDSFLGVFDLPGPGTYFIAVSTFDNYATATFTATSVTSLTRPDGVVDPSDNLAVDGVTLFDSSFVRSGVQLGSDYTLHVSVQDFDPAVVPEPASIAIWSLGAGGILVAGYLRRGRRREKELLR